MSQLWKSTATTLLKQVGLQSKYMHIKTWSYKKYVIETTMQAECIVIKQ